MGRGPIIFITRYIHVSKRDALLVVCFKVNSHCHIAGQLLNITVGLTNDKPGIKGEPLNSSFWPCATHHAPVKGEPIDLECDEQLHQGRYLFVAATVRDYFHLSEVEVYTGKLWNEEHYYRPCRPERYILNIFHSNIICGYIRHTPTHASTHARQHTRTHAHPHACIIVFIIPSTVTVGCNVPYKSLFSCIR